MLCPFPKPLDSDIESRTQNLTASLVHDHDHDHDHEHDHVDPSAFLISNLHTPSPLITTSAIRNVAQSQIEAEDSARISALDGHHGHEYVYVTHFVSGLIPTAHTDNPVFPTSVHGARNKRAAREPVPVTGILFNGTSLALFESPVVPISTADAQALSSSPLHTPFPSSSSFQTSQISSSSSSFPALHGSSITHYSSHADREAASLARHAENEELFASKFTSFTTTGPIRTLIFLVQFSNEGGPATTEANYAQTMTRLNDYWGANSYGLSSYSPIEYEIITLTNTKSSYAVGGQCPIDFGKSSLLDDDVWAASSNLEGDYDRYVICFSEYTECPWAGLGSIAATGSWINGLFDAAAHSHVAIHELGHNYGLRHANLWASTAAPPVGDGQSLPYGDDFDIMGAVTISADRSSFHVNTHKKHGLDWIPNEDRITATTTGQYRIFSHDAIDASSGPRALRIQRGSGSSTWYWLEYRTHLDFAPATPFFVNGANIHWCYELSSFETETDLIDMTPAYNTENLYDDTLNNSPLQLGTTFSDPLHTIHFTPIGTSSLGGQPFLDVFVSFDPPNAAPIINSVTASCVQPEVEESVLLIADVTEPDGDLLAYSWDFGDGTLSSSNSIAVSHGWNSPGVKTVTLTVSDMRGSVVIATVSPQVIVAASGGGICPPCPNSCSGQGICSGGVCACSPGFTGADCSQVISVSAIVPNFGPIGGGNTVTISGSGFVSNATSYLCNFQGLGLRPATKINANTLTCVAPTATSKTTVIVEVSPNNGLHYTGSAIGYTFGGGLCPNNCTYQGDCDIGPGVCTCFPGFTGDDCSIPIGASNLVPLDQGPRSGGSLVSVDVTPAVLPPPAPAGPWDAAGASPSCQFGSTTPVPATRVGSVITCKAPPYGAAGVTVPLQVSPNGRDFTNSTLTFTYRPVIELREGATTATVSTLAGEYAFFRFPVGDITGLTVTTTLAVTSGSPTLLGQSNAVPVLGVGGSSSIPGAGDLVMAGSQLETGVLFFSVVSPSSAADFTLLLATSGTHNLLAGNEPIPSSVTAGSPNFYSVSHAGPGTAMYISTDVPAGGTQPTLYLSGTTQTPSASDSDATGTSVVAQPCFAAGTYFIAVEGDGPYAIFAQALTPPVPGTLGTEEPGKIVSQFREESSVNISLALATSAETYDFDLGYDVFFRRNTDATPFTTACEIKAGGTVFRQNIRLGSFGTPVIQIAPLDASTNYQVGIVVRDSNGVEQAYLPALQKTKPPPIPKALIYGLIAGSVGVALIAGCVVGFFRLRKKKRKKRKHRTKGIVRRRRKTRRGRSHNTTQPGVAAAAGAGIPRRGKRKGGPRHADARKTRHAAGPAYATGGPMGPPPGTSTAMVPASAGRSNRKAKAKRKSRHPSSAPAPAGAGVSGGRPAVARGAFRAQHPNELSFPKGAHLVVIAPMESGWVKAQYNGKIGLAPSSYLKMH